MKIELREAKVKYMNISNIRVASALGSPNPYFGGKRSSSVLDLYEASLLPIPEAPYAIRL